MNTTPSQRPKEREAKALTRVLAPYRSGGQGELRAQVRCMLVRLMGFASGDDIPVGIRKIPHWFPGRSGLEPDEMRDMMMVAQDGLIELGYEAAAEELTHYTDEDAGYDLMPDGTKNIRRRCGGGAPEYQAERFVQNIEIGAKNALENLESGSPSVLIDLYTIVTKSIRRYKMPNGEYLVGRHATYPRWWLRFARGKAVHNQRGELVGWDNEAGYTFSRRGRTLKDALAAKYGSVALTAKKQG